MQLPKPIITNLHSQLASHVLKLKHKNKHKKKHAHQKYSVKQQPLLKILLIAPDFTRYTSGMGKLTCLVAQQLKPHKVYVLPATGTHALMTSIEKKKMYPGLHVLAHTVNKAVFSGAFLLHREIKIFFPSLPKMLFCDVPLLTSPYLLPRASVASFHKGLCGDDFSMIISIGSVVPHEVVGMANYSKNIVIGLGGHSLIDLTHFASALYGMRKILAVTKNPIRDLLNLACKKLANKAGFSNKLYYLLSAGAFANCGDKEVCYSEPSHSAAALVSKHITLVRQDEKNILVAIKSLNIAADNVGKNKKPLMSTKNANCLFWGKTEKVFINAAAVAQSNVLRFGRTFDVVFVQVASHVHNLWIANKAIYRVGGLVSRGGSLVVLASGVDSLAYNSNANVVIEKYGYISIKKITEILQLEYKKKPMDAEGIEAKNMYKNTHSDEVTNKGVKVVKDIKLTDNLAVAAHLVHGHAENYNVVYAVNNFAGLSASKTEILLNKVGYSYINYKKALKMRSAALCGCSLHAAGLAISKTENEAVLLQDPALGLYTK